MQQIMQETVSIWECALFSAFCTHSASKQDQLKIRPSRKRLHSTTRVSHHEKYRLPLRGAMVGRQGTRDSIKGSPVQTPHDEFPPDGCQSPFMEIIHPFVCLKGTG